MSECDIAKVLDDFVSFMLMTVKKHSFRNEQNHYVFQLSLDFFKSTYGKLVEGYCNIISQMPTNYFDTKSDFERNVLYKELKTMIEEIIKKSQQLNSELETLAEKINGAGASNVMKKDESFLSCKKIDTHNNQVNNIRSHEHNNANQRINSIFSISNEKDDNLSSTSQRRPISSNNRSDLIKSLATINNKKCDGTTGKFDGFNFLHSKRMKEIAAVRFGLEHFRDNQLQVINAAMLGHDCFVLMPTGGGKSLCYQLPALLNNGITIVISPLKSLILDQITNLKSMNIVANKLTGEYQNDVYKDLKRNIPLTKILYITPEKFATSKEILYSLYVKNLISRFVIDEVHCVSQWGHDFRPDYKKLGVLREYFRKVKIMVLTSTATLRVRLDILNQLKLNEPKWFISSLNRSNLKYTVLNKQCQEDALNDIVRFLTHEISTGSGIIYCLSRQDCEYVAKIMCSNDITAEEYHAGCTDESRESTQKKWSQNKVRVICATTAFGMGIDKPDVRFVIHFAMPRSIEGYYQECGRAGRDGKLAHCILYYIPYDIIRLQDSISNNDESEEEVKRVHFENLKHVVSYCENNVDCRRLQQLEYLDENFQPEKCLEKSACDNCLEQKNDQKIDALEHARKAVNCIKELCSVENTHYTLFDIADVLYGEFYKVDLTNSSHYGVLSDWTKFDIQRLLRIMVAKEYLQENIIFNCNIPQKYIFVGRKVEEIMQHVKKLEFVLISTNENVQEPEDDWHSILTKANYEENEKRLVPIIQECTLDSKKNMEKDNHNANQIIFESKTKRLRMSND